MLERLTGDNVIAIQESSVNINGRTYGSVADLPAPIRWLFELAKRQAAVDRGEAIEQREVIAVFVAGAVIVGGAWLIVHMDPGSKSQGGAFYVMLGILVVLLWVGGVFVNIYWRRK